MSGRNLRAAIVLLAGLCSLYGALPASAQTKNANAKKKPEVVTLTGCVQPAEKTPGQFTLEDKDTGVTYRLTGAKVHDFVGQTVLIVGGSESKKLVVKGGLLPNPNVAAQGSSMDPARIAVASQGGSAGPGTVELPEFNVKSVQPTGASCR